jgi:hypothetical protein
VRHRGPARVPPRREGGAPRRARRRRQPGHRRGCGCRAGSRRVRRR